MARIEHLRAREILDSRGRPTLSATCDLEGGASASASIPSGASTGSSEALELRDGEMNRYRGLGCRRAVANLNTHIADHVRGRDFDSQEAFDQALILLDATENKGRLGANAILAASIAFARACARHDGVPLYEHLSRLIGVKLSTLPRLTVNLFSGGKHAGGQVAIQDVLVVPASATTIDQSLAMVWAVYQAAMERVAERYAMRGLRADEGGLAPAFARTEDMFEDAIASISAAGFAPGRDVALAIDVAATHFFKNDVYYLDGEHLDAGAMVRTIDQWVRRYPIVSVEDGLSEEDWAHWPTLERILEGRALTLGDDLLCTNPVRIERAARDGAANALLLKVNQIGTLTEAARALKIARANGWAVTVSARSGETEDDWLADLAVGWQADQIKVGSITQSERLAKYNRLLEIEAQTRLPIVRWPDRVA